MKNIIIGVVSVLLMVLLSACTRTCEFQALGMKCKNPGSREGKNGVVLCEDCYSRLQDVNKRLNEANRAMEKLQRDLDQSAKDIQADLDQYR